MVKFPLRMPLKEAIDIVRVMYESNPMITMDIQIDDWVELWRNNNITSLQHFGNLISGLVGKQWFDTFKTIIVSIKYSCPIYEQWDRFMEIATGKVMTVWGMTYQWLIYPKEFDNAYYPLTALVRLPNKSDYI